MARNKKLKKKNKKNKPSWSKLIVLIVCTMGFLIVQECLFLMYVSIHSGYTATAAWLTAAVGVGEAVLIAGTNGYLSLCKVDHTEGGITFESAKANNFNINDDIYSEGQMYTPDFDMDENINSRAI